MAREKDTRKIISGVQLPVAGAGAGGRQGGTTLRTFHAEADLDALEECMTPEQCERLKGMGAIAGDWSPKGQAPPPMPGSPAHQAMLRGEKLPESPRPQRAERPPAGEPVQPPPDVSPRPEEVVFEAQHVEEVPNPEPPPPEPPPPEPPPPEPPPPEEDTGKKGRKRGW